LDSAAIWHSLLSTIRAQLGPETFDRWFGPCVVKENSSKHLCVMVPNVFYRNWILEHYGPFIQEQLREMAGAEGQLSIEINGEAAPTTPSSKTGRGHRRRPSSPASIRRTSFNDGSKLNLKYTFDNFIEGSCNRFARAASLAAAEAPGLAYNPLFIYGGAGLGKTHLMQAIGHYMLSRLNGVRIHYASSEQFTNHLINSLQTRKMELFRRSYRDTNALLIDDIEFLSGKEQTQEEFFHTFNALYDLRSQIVISSDRPPSELANMEERLVSRFQSGLVVDLQVPELETRVAILLKNAADSHIVLPEDIAFFIADRIRANIRELEGALVRLAYYASSMKQPLTVDLAQHVLKDILARQRGRGIPIDTIQKKVAEFFDIRVADMKTNRRPKTIAFPRQIAMYLARELTNHSLQEIGEAFGGRDHSTVIHAHKLVKRKMDADPNLKMVVSRLKDETARS
jgi:chromosomal replication initiator protein